jgi:Na+/H+-dicarboxylate symporter
MHICPAELTLLTALVLAAVGGATVPNASRIVARLRSLLRFRG